MTSIPKNILIIGFIALFIIVLAVWWSGKLGSTVPAESQVSAAAAALLTSNTYAIVSDTWTNSLNAGLETAITGDVCYTTAPDTAPISINGVTITPLTEATVPCPTQVGLDQASALADLNAESCTPIGTDVALDAIIIGTNPPGVFPPGCYESSGAMDITLSTTVTLDLTAPGGDGGNVWIFRSGGPLTTGANSLVALANGALASNVFWTPGGLASLGANSSTSATPTFVGTIIADELGSTGINVGHFVHMSGRLLAFGHTITTDSNTISIPPAAPATLNVIKHVVNDNVGTSTASAWTLTVSSSNGGSGTGSAAGAESPGTAYTLQAGKAYSVAESGGPAGYGTSASSDCTIASAVSGATYTCTITNDDTPPASATLHIIKSVINVSGTAVPSDFLIHVKSATSTLDVTGSPLAGATTPGALYTLSAGAYIVTEAAHPSLPTYTQTFGLDCVGGTFTLAAGEDKICTVINTDIPPPAPAAASGGSGGSFAPLPLIKVTKVPTPLALPAGPGSVAYIYTATNIGTVPMIGVWVKDDTCTAVTFVSGDINGDSKLDLDEAWTYRCIQTVSETVTNTATAHGQANGHDAYDTALATVVVGVVPGLPDTGLLPPLINIVKVPSRLTPFPFGGGNVTYTYTVTNPGAVAMHDVTVTDDKCASVARISGDTNSDNLLDTGESWTYTCQANVPISTSNIATAKGAANGFIALDYALATVLVGSPGFPNTGLPPRGSSTP
ncbi:MAG: ice-binding family protein [Patescibacteria group bacterium]|nr:ice-binding family protein [Patescibacteria group bacterium]